jgi:hypothetical protein
MTVTVVTPTPFDGVGLVAHVGAIVKLNWKKQQLDKNTALLLNKATDHLWSNIFSNLMNMEVNSNLTQKSLIEKNQNEIMKLYPIMYF